MSTDTLDELRTQIDVIDAQILDLFAKRTSLATQIGVYKREHNLSILDSSREQQKIEMAKASVPEYLKPSTVLLMHVLMDAAKSRQSHLS
mgnify:FL=1